MRSEKKANLISETPATPPHYSYWCEVRFLLNSWYVSVAPQTQLMRDASGAVHRNQSPV